MTRRIARLLILTLALAPGALADGPDLSGLFGQGGGGEAPKGSAEEKPVIRPRTSRPAGSTGKWDLLPPAVRADLARVFEQGRKLGHAAKDDADLHAAWRPRHHGDWARYRFEHGLNGTQRRTLLTLHAKMKHEKLWDAVEAIRDVPDSFGEGFVVFDPAVSDLTAHLGIHHLYKTWEGWDDEAWGLQSPSSGVQLVFQGPKKGKGDEFSRVRLDRGNRDDEKQSHDKRWGSTRFQAEVEKQGLRVPEVDTYWVGGRLANGARSGGKWMTAFTKWKCTPHDTFGYLWLNMENARAGWWVNSKDTRSFDTVEYLRDKPDPNWKLEYPNGWVVIRVVSNSEIKGRWFKRSEKKVIEFTGKLFEGSVRNPGGHS